MVTHTRPAAEPAPRRLRPALCVGVLALDPTLDVGVSSALRGRPELSVVLPGELAEVMVLVADGVTGAVLGRLRELRGGAHRPEVVLVATELTVAQAMDAIAAGAGGLLRRREVEPARLARAVLAAAGGDCAVPPDVLAALLEQGVGRTSPGSAPGGRPGAGLSEREQAVLALIAEGRETDEIARELCYSPRTVVGVVHDVTRRLRLRNRAHAVAYVLRAGLL
jgi:DNA-binding NarL/FixJ family response regulator